MDYGDGDNTWKFPNWGSLNRGLGAHPLTII